MVYLLKCVLSIFAYVKLWLLLSITNILISAIPETRLNINEAVEKSSVPILPKQYDKSIKASEARC